MLPVLKIIKDASKHRLALIMICIIGFACIYMLFDESEFSGTEEVVEKIKGLDKEDKKLESLFHRIFARIYFSIVTMSTIGYGDIYPISIRARTVVMMQVLALLYITYV